MKDPIQWHARDALSTAVPAVAEDMRPHEAGSRPEGHDAYAVFDELPTETENVRFLGLVSPVVAKRFPLRIFADLLPKRLPAPIPHDTTLDRVTERFHRDRADALPVMSNDEEFLGVVTRRSLTETLLLREYHLRDSLEKELAVLRASDHRLTLSLTGTEHELADTKRQLQLLGEELITTEHREREKLVDVLHDSLTPLLYVARLRVTKAIEMTRKANAKSLLQSADKVLQECHEVARGLMAALQPGQLAPHGLARAVERLGQDMSQDGFHVTVRAEPMSRPIGEESARCAFWAIRELLHNAIKHSGSSTAHVTLCQDQDEESLLRVIIADQGLGMSIPSPSGSTSSYSNGSPKSGYGILRITDRVQTLGGRLVIDSVPGHGTVVTFTIPLTF